MGCCMMIDDMVQRFCDIAAVLLLHCQYRSVSRISARFRVGVVINTLPRAMLRAWKEGGEWMLVSGVWSCG